MGREALLKMAAEYKDAVKNAETKKPAALVYNIEGITSGTVEYQPECDLIDIKYGGNKLRIPGSAVHSLAGIFDRIENA